MSSKKQPIPNSQPNRLWDALNEIHRNCAAYSVIPASLAPFMRNSALIALIEDQGELLNHSAILARDVKEYAAKLSAIHAKHAERAGNSDDHNDLMRVIQIQEEYIEWATSYENVVLPIVHAIVDMFDAVGTKIEISRQPLAPVVSAPSSEE